MGELMKVTLASVAGATLMFAPGATTRTPETSMTAVTIEIPKSIQQEHAAIHAALVEATQAPGRVGVAARALAAVLHPHFVREEEIALPPLGLLARLAAGELPTEATEVLTLSDSLKAEMPRMLEEHTRIRAAVAELRAAARADRSIKFQQLADELALHALTEEEVLYPAAILVGDIIRSRAHVRRSP